MADRPHGRRAAEERRAGKAAPPGRKPPARPGAHRRPARAPTRRRRRAAPEAGRTAAPLPPRAGFLQPRGAGRRARPPPRPEPRREALTHLSFSVPKMEAKYSAISHPPPPPPPVLPTPPTLPDARERRHPDATTLVPPRRRVGAAQSGETLPACGRGLARAGGTAPSSRGPARLGPAPSAGVSWLRAPSPDPGPGKRSAHTAAARGRRRVGGFCT